MLSQFLRKYKFYVIIISVSFVFLTLLSLITTYYVVKITLENINSNNNLDTLVIPSPRVKDTESPTGVVNRNYSNENCNGVTNDSSDNSRIDSNLNKIRDSLGICISFLVLPEISFPSQKSDPLVSSDFERLEVLSEYFVEEYSKYNKEFIKNIKLKQVVFMKNNEVANQVRAAVPDYIKDIVYYDISLASYDLYSREVIHHELYHNIEESFYGDTYYFDETWNSFNAPGFKYGKGGYYCQSTVPDLSKGFVSGYSKCGLEEDKAEVFSHLMVPEDKEIIKREIQKGDKVLEKKVNYMINFLRNSGLSINI